MPNNRDFQISTAEFKGRTLQSLEGIKKDVASIKKDLKKKACKKDVENLRKEINNIKLSSAIVGGVGGVLTAVGAFLGLKKL
jgi:F0F1-type ATP synthase assembly protein I|tara:strand:+ start:389 stop:634 length:246 start_codon:yes stop_codon:yes gene_type:complete